MGRRRRSRRRRRHSDISEFDLLNAVDAYYGIVILIYTFF